MVYELAAIYDTILTPKKALKPLSKIHLFNTHIIDWWSPVEQTDEIFDKFLTFSSEFVKIF